MSNKKSLNQLYREILETAWSKANEKGTIMRLSDPETQEYVPALIEDNTDSNKKKVAVLPLQENLVGLDATSFIVVHPLNENPSKPASPIVDFLRRMMSVRINWIFSTILPELLDFAATPAKHDSLSPEQFDILTVLKDVGKDSAAKFLRLLEASKDANGHNGVVVSVYLARGASVNGKSYHRAAIAKFTLYEDLCRARDQYNERKEAQKAERERKKKTREKDEVAQEEKKNDNDIVVLGVKISKKDLDCFLKLFERIVPAIGNKDSYSTGSNANVAPFMEAMLVTFMKLFTVTNDFIKEYSVAFSAPDALSVPMEWTDEILDIESLASIVRLVPPQRGNEGSNRVDEQLRSTQTADVSNFKPTATRDASGNPLTPQPRPVEEAKPVEAKPAAPAFNAGTVSYNATAASGASTPPWEATPSFQPPSVNNGRISFSSLTVAQNVNRGTGFGTASNNRPSPFGGRSGFSSFLGTGV